VHGMTWRAMPVRPWRLGDAEAADAAAAAGAGGVLGQLNHFADMVGRCSLTPG